MKICCVYCEKYEQYVRDTDLSKKDRTGVTQKGHTT